MEKMYIFHYLNEYIATFLKGELFFFFCLHMRPEGVFLYTCNLVLKIKERITVNNQSLCSSCSSFFFSTLSNKFIFCFQGIRFTTNWCGERGEDAFDKV